MGIKHDNICDLEIGKKYSGIYICKSHNVLKTKDGKDMVSFIFEDKTGTIEGVWFEPTPEFLNTEKTTNIDADFIGIKFEVSKYKDKPQAKLSNWMAITPDIIFDKADIVPAASNIEEMFDELYNTANNFENEDLKKLTTTILMERKQEFLVTPGAKSVHHAVVGGLLLHETGMLHLAKAIAPLYPNINAELLYAGVILHDVCKIDEFDVTNLGLVSDYTIEGNLLGHITMGVEYIGKMCDKLNIKKETATVIKHMIESHHGIPEHGSAIPPMFFEAVLLHEIDYIDSRNYIMSEAIKDVADHELSQRIFALDNIRVYKHNLNS